MAQKRTYRDQCPEPTMAFQDLHLLPLQFGKKYLTVFKKMLPFSCFIQQYNLLVNQISFL